LDGMELWRQAFWHGGNRTPCSRLQSARCPRSPMAGRRRQGLRVRRRRGNARPCKARLHEMARQARGSSYLAWPQGGHARKPCKRPGINAKAKAAMQSPGGSACAWALAMRRRADQGTAVRQVARLAAIFKAPGHAWPGAMASPMPRAFLGMGPEDGFSRGNRL